jgi:hypothetical protein
MGWFDTGPVNQRPVSGSAPLREVDGSRAAAVAKSKLPESVGEAMSWADIGT